MLSNKSVLTIVVALFSSLILDAQVCTNGNTKITVQPQAQKICEGNTSTLTVSATGDNLKYAWTHDSNPIGENSNKFMIPAANRGVDDGMYSVTVTGDCGIALSNEVNVEVYSEPIAKISSVSKLEACQLEGEIQIATSSINDYDLGTWISDVKPSGSGDFYTVNTSDLKVGSNTLDWQVSNAACGNRNDQVTITIHSTTIPTISLASIPTICYGDNATFKAQIGSEDIDGTYVWDFTGDDLAPTTTNKAQHTFYNIQSDGEVFVSYTSGLKCDSKEAITASVELKGVNAPVIKLLSGDTSFCETNAFDLKGVNSAQNIENTVYLWRKVSSTANRNASTVDGEIILKNIKESGSYALTADNGVCEVVVSEEIFVTVYKVPYVDASVNNASEISVFEGDLLSLDGSHSGQIAVWSMVGDVNPIFEDEIDLSSKIATLNNEGVYYIKLTATDGPCIASDVVTIEIKKPTGVNQLISKNQSTTLFIEGLENYEDLKILTFDLTGRTIDELNYSKENNFNASNYALGTYVYRIVNATSVLKSGVFVVVD
jgi:hypothetical protein